MTIYLKYLLIYYLFMQQNYCWKNFRNVLFSIFPRETLIYECDIKLQINITKTDK